MHSLSLVLSTGIAFGVAFLFVCCLLYLFRPSFVLMGKYIKDKVEQVINWRTVIVFSTIIACIVSICMFYHVGSTRNIPGTYYGGLEEKFVPDSTVAEE